MGSSADWDELVGEVAASGRNPLSVQLVSTTSETVTVLTPSSDSAWCIRSLYLYHTNVAANASISLASDATTLASYLLGAAGGTSNLAQALWLHNGGHPILVGRAHGDPLKFTSTVSAGTLVANLQVDEVRLRQS